MSGLPRAAGLAYRAAGDSSDRVALLVHGVPESSADLPAGESSRTVAAFSSEMCGPFLTTPTCDGV